jgi:hypothetical protein
MVNAGFVLCLAAVLFAAAVLKMRDAVSFESTLVRLLPASFWGRFRISSRFAARAALAVEAVLAGLLIVGLGGNGRLVIRVVTALLFMMFTALVLFARRREVSCGCFDSSEGEASGTTVFRSVVLLAVAMAVAANAIVGPNPPFRFSISALGVAFAVAVIAWLPGIVGTWRRKIASSVIAVNETQHLMPSGPAPTRRLFLTRALGIAGALLTAAPLALAASAQAQGCYNCAAIYEDCESCANDKGSQKGSAKNCCYACFLICDGGGSCPDDSCVGCWKT